MGRDKAGVDLRGRTLAIRSAEALVSVTSPTLAVGREAGTGLETVTDRFQGPLAALVEGASVLAARGIVEPIVVVAADMPFVSAGLLRHLVEALVSSDASLPIAGGRDQPLCACYAPAAIGTAARLVAEGARAMHELITALPTVVRVPEAEWTAFAPPYALLDVDSPEDLAAAERILDAPA
jgi:molybdopterin-guanine dinucleotide biosynthesis protein A